MKYYIASIFLLFFVTFALFLFDYRGGSYLIIKNYTNNATCILINEKEYTLNKKYTSIGYVFPFSGRVDIKSCENKIKYNCNIENKPFGLCAFEILVEENSIYCGKCFSL